MYTGFPAIALETNKRSYDKLLFLEVMQDLCEIVKGIPWKTLEKTSIVSYGVPALRLKTSSKKLTLNYISVIILVRAV